MAYYKSTDKSELESYNTLVVESENYDGIKTVRWGSIYSHPNGLDFAIIKHPSYSVTELTEVETLGSEWFPEEE